MVFSSPKSLSSEFGTYQTVRTKFWPGIFRLKPLKHFKLFHRCLEAALHSEPGTLDPKHSGLHQTPNS